MCNYENYKNFLLRNLELYVRYIDWKCCTYPTIVGSSVCTLGLYTSAKLHNKIGRSDVTHFIFTKGLISHINIKGTYVYM